ncbi:36457_t:CDS:2, partial [Racocetra persica]
MSLSLYPGTNCTPEEWYEYCKMPQVRENETPGEWKERIWDRLQYFREHSLLPTQSKKYLEASELISFPNNTPYARNYNYIGMERHWKFSYIGNKYCGVNHDEYLKIKQKPKYNFDDKKIERARDVGRKIQAYIIIQQKVVEWIY